jgi:hypothetical protein
MKSKKSDYLKYWRIVRHYIKVKYNISQSDLEILLFLHTEPYFTKDKFAEFNSVISWDRKRFDRLNQEGWIEGIKTFRVGRRMKYSLSYRATRLVEEVYRILEGKEIPTSESTNPMFKRNVSYTDKVYRNFIMNLRTKSKQQQRHAPE